MKKELRYITSLFLLPAVTVTAQQETDFSFPCAEGTVAVRGADFEKVNKKDTSEAHISMTMLFDSLKVRSNRYVAITPILESADSAYRKLFTPVVIAGRRQHIVSERDSALVPQYRGYDFMYLKDAKKEPYAYADVTEYQSWMDGAHLRFYNDECGCCELKDSGMADTPFKTPRNLLELIKFPQLSPVEKLYHLHGSAYVNFVVNKTELRPDYMNNGVELSKITDTLDIMTEDKNVDVRLVKIHGYASPESPYVHNKELAESRAQTLTDFVRKRYSLPDSVFAPAEATPENWAGLRQAVENGWSDNKEGLLELIDEALNVPDAEGWRCDDIEKTIRSRYPADYKYLLTTVYPTLRRSDYEVTFVVRGFDSDEADEMMRRNPSYLSADELAKLASLYATDSQEYQSVFEVAERNIGELSEQSLIERSNLTMAVAALKKGDTETGRKFLTHSGDSPEADNARGVACLLDGDKGGARKYLTSAADAGIAEAKENLALLEE